MRRLELRTGNLSKTEHLQVRSGGSGHYEKNVW